MPRWIESFDYDWNGILLTVDCWVEEVSGEGKGYEIEVQDVQCGDSLVEFNEIAERVDDKTYRPLADRLEEVCRERLRIEVAA